MNKSIVLPLLLALSLPAVAGEHDHQHASSTDTAIADEYVNAEVRKIDADNGKLTLKHEALKQFDMPGMTMGFRVADPAMLAPLAVGDKVRFIPGKVNGQYVVKKIEKMN